MAEDTAVVESPAAPAQPSAPAAPASPQGPSPVQSGSRDTGPDKGLLADLQRERQQRQQLQQQFEQHRQQAQQWQAQLEERNRQIQALTGARTPSPDQAQEEEVRARFAQLFPGLAKLSDQQIEKIIALSDSSQSLEQTTQHYWRQHATGMLTDLASAVGDELGGDLTDRQKAALVASYIRNAEQDPDFLARHEAGDQKLIQEFAKAWVEDWFEPARRRVTQTAVGQQRRVPNGRATQPVTTGKTKIDFNDPKAVEDAMIASFTEHGGTFGHHR